jgi:hypothetical protein
VLAEEVIGAVGGERAAARATPDVRPQHGAVEARRGGHPATPGA